MIKWCKAKISYKLVVIRITMNNKNSLLISADHVIANMKSRVDHAFAGTSHHSLMP